MKSVVKKPVGPSERHWNNTHTGTSEAICEWCGTSHPESDRGYTLLDVLDRQVVLECCGAVVDKLYDEWGPEFTRQSLEDFGDGISEDPLLLTYIINAFKKAKDTARKLQENIEKTMALLPES